MPQTPFPANGNYWLLSHTGLHDSDGICDITSNTICRSAADLHDIMMEYLVFQYNDNSTMSVVYRNIYCAYNVVVVFVESQFVLDTC